MSTKEVILTKNLSAISRLVATASSFSVASFYSFIENCIFSEPTKEEGIYCYVCMVSVQNQTLNVHIEIASFCIM